MKEKTAQFFEQNLQMIKSKDNEDLIIYEESNEEWDSSSQMLKLHSRSRSNHNANDERDKNASNSNEECLTKDGVDLEGKYTEENEDNAKGEEYLLANLCFPLFFVFMRCLLNTS